MGPLSTRGVVAGLGGTVAAVVLAVTVFSSSDDPAPTTTLGTATPPPSSATAGPTSTVAPVPPLPRVNLPSAIVAPPKPATSSTPKPAPTSTIKAAAAPALKRVAITKPRPIVTGLPYPAKCTFRHTAAGAILPDPTCTPGSVDPAVTQANIATTICRPGGYTDSVRPSSANTNLVKTYAMKAYGVPESKRSTTEFDHYVPLGLAGSNDSTNLFPQPSDLPGKGVTNSKDAVESRLHDAVCARKVSLVAAQSAIATNWTTAERVLGLKK
jgi:hypothetical protein